MVIYPILTPDVREALVASLRELEARRAQIAITCTGARAFAEGEVEGFAHAIATIFGAAVLAEIVRLVVQAEEAGR